MWSDQTLLEEGRRTAAGRVARELTQRIADGSLAPGSKLPGETVLARRLGVSRPTLREAIRTLAARGLLEVRPRSGTYVAPALPGLPVASVVVVVAADPSRFWELLEVRRMVDVAAAELAARRRTSADLAGFGGLATSLRKATGAGPGGLDAWWGSYVRFFTLLAGATHNTLVTHLAAGVTRSVGDAAPAGLLQALARPRPASAVAAQLLAIYRAVEAGDPEAAREAAEAHLDFFELTLRNQDL